MPESDDIFPEAAGQILEYEDGRRVVLDEDDAPELTPEILARMRPMTDFPEMLASLQAAQTKLGEDVAAGRVKRVRGPQKAPTKQQVTLRLDADVVAHFKADGPGWTQRVNAALREVMDRA